MESSASTSDALVRPWRTATFVASAIAAFELFILVGFVVALFGGPALHWLQGSDGARTAKQQQTQAAARQPAPPPAARAAPKLARTETSVLVLNGNGIAGAAASAGQLVRRKGYVVAEVGNAARTDYRRTVVMYRPGYQPEAARFARDLHVKIVSPLDGLRRKDLMGAHVAMVLGAN